jgi:hypothetical protein
MANIYVRISTLNAINSTYSLYFDSISSSNLIASGVSQGTLTGVGYLVDTAGHSSVIIKSEDPDCCCNDSAKTYIFPTPTSTPTTTPTNTPPATPTNTPLAATPTNTPLAATPTNTPPPPTPTNTVTPPPPTATVVPECGTFGEFGKISGDGNLFSTTISAGSSGVGGTTVATGSITTTGNNCSISIRAFSGTGGSNSQGQISVSFVGTVSTTVAGPGGGIQTTASIVIPLAGTYDITLSGTFTGGTNPPTDANSVYLFIT